MKIVKYLIIFIAISGSLLLLVAPQDISENNQLQEVLNFASDKNVVIIFNSGGWGNTPLEEAEDFAPLVKGIQEMLKEKGYDSIIISYNRTKDTLLGKVAGIKDFLSSFNLSSQVLAKDLGLLTENLPDKKIIVAGLSAGGVFTDETLKKISPKSKVYAIEAGIPFWHKNFESENILKLNNNGNDSLSRGDIRYLVLAVVEAPFRWTFAKIVGQNITLSQAFHARGHDYSWESPEVKAQIVTFLEDKFR